MKIIIEGTSKEIVDLGQNVGVLPRIAIPSYGYAHPQGTPIKVGESDPNSDNSQPAKISVMVGRKEVATIPLSEGQEEKELCEEFHEQAFRENPAKSVETLRLPTKWG